MNLLGDSLDLGWLILAFLLVVVAIAGWILSARLRSGGGIPAGEIIYSDHGTWFPQEEPLYSDRYNLVGRPDYLVQEQNGAIIPVEVKSSASPPELHEGHILQLAAYCLLVEELYGVRPTYGILQYRDNAFSIQYTDSLEEDLLDLLEEMQDNMYLDELDRDHDDWRRCSQCGVREYCQQQLV